MDEKDSRPLFFVVVAGPTASGKSELALELAERFTGEIVNADSRQIYRFMDIGTAKPGAEERRRVPHHLYDIADPDETFDAARFGRLARDAVREIAARGRLPVVTGGTGLYLRTLCRGVFGGPAAHGRLRRALEAIEEKAPGTLHRWCRRLDPSTARRLHPNDRVRLVRALEVALLTGAPLSSFHDRHRFGESLGEFLFFVLDPGRSDLDERIRDRSRKMFEIGLLAEVERLWKRGYGPELRVLQSIGYREATAVLRGERSVEQALEDLVRSTRQFARRQLTWFRAEPDVVWIHPARDRERALDLVAELMRRRPNGGDPRRRDFTRDPE